MIQLKPFLVIIILAFIPGSCDWINKPDPCDASGPVVVYKTRQDYSENVTIQLSGDGKVVTAYPGKLDAVKQRPVELINGYLLKRMTGDAVTSLTIEEYASSAIDYSPADLLNLVIDKDPYLEKYECCKCTKGDTAVINDLIRKNQLNNCDSLK